jgi:hypothetical protein
MNNAVKTNSLRDVSICMYMEMCDEVSTTSRLALYCTNTSVKTAASMQSVSLNLYHVFTTHRGFVIHQIRTLWLLSTPIFVMFSMFCMLRYIWHHPLPLLSLSRSLCFISCLLMIASRSMTFTHSTERTAYSF